MTFTRGTLTYDVKAFTYTVFVQTKEEQVDKQGRVKLDANGDPKHKGVPMSRMYVYFEVVTPNRDGMVWRFVGTGSKKRPYTFSDSRDTTTNAAKSKRLTIDQLESEIARMTSAEFGASVMREMVSVHYQDERGESGVAKQAVADLLGCTLVPSFTAEGHPTTEMVGGLLGRIEGQRLALVAYNAKEKQFRR